MKPIQIPEDLSGLSETELTELGSEIKDRVESLADEARNSDEALSQVEGLISDFDRITEELDNREQASADRSARLDAAMERFGGTDEESAEDSEDAATDEEDADEAAASDEATDEAADEDTTEVDAEADEAVAASTDEESTEELSTQESDEASTEDVTEAAAEDTTEAAAESTEEASTEAPAEAATTEESTTEFTAEVEAPEAEVEASTKDDESTEFTNDQEVTEVADDKTPNTVARLSERRPEAIAPESAPQRPAAGLAARFTNGSTNDGDSITVADLAQAIVEKRLSMGNVPSGIFDKISVASATLDFGDDVVGGGAQENFSVFRKVAGQHGALREEMTSLVASGGVCAPLEPSYDFFRLADEMDPVERCLPTVGAPRGGIRFITPPDWRDACPGVRVTTEAEDAAGYVSQGGPTPDKPCVAVECPPIEECRVDAVSQCVTFGNLNYRVFPEQVEAFLADLSVCFTETKEIFYLDAIDAASTPVTAGPSPYGASRSIAYDLSVAAANYRRRHHMSPDSTLSVLLPSWTVEFIKIDMLNDHSLGLSNWCLSDADVVCWFAQNNLDVCFYYDSATGAGQAFNDIQAPGAINQWPDTLVSYMFAPGTFVRLDAGTLDVGLVRDSILNGTNDLQLFAEQWIQVCKIGLESLRIEHTVCPTGAATEPVPPLVCAAGVS